MPSIQERKGAHRGGDTQGVEERGQVQGNEEPFLRFDVHGRQYRGENAWKRQGARSWGQGDASLRRQRYKLFTQSRLHHLLCKNSRTKGWDRGVFTRTDESRTMPRTTEQGHRAPCRHHQLGEQQCKTYRATNGCNNIKSIRAERWKFVPPLSFMSRGAEKKVAKKPIFSFLAKELHFHTLYNHTKPTDDCNLMYHCLGNSLDIVLTVQHQSDGVKLHKP